MQTRSSRLTVMIALVPTLTMLLAGCGGGEVEEGAGGGQGSTDGATELKVGFIPVGTYSYLWHARDKGYFKENNLSVELVPMGGGGEIVPALQSGELQFGISDSLGVINSRSEGIAANYVSFNWGESAKAPVHALVTDESSITSAADLSGKSVATNLSYNTDWTTTRMWLRQKGVNVENVSFREVPFPDMLKALRNDVVDAAHVIEPFRTLAKKEGFRVIGHPFTDVKSPVYYSGVAAMEEYVSTHEGVARRFVGAVDKAIRDFNEDPQVAREVIAKHTEISKELVRRMNLGDWRTDVSPRQMRFWVNGAKQEGLITESLPVNELVWRGASGS